MTGANCGHHSIPIPHAHLRSSDPKTLWRISARRWHDLPGPVGRSFGSGNIAKTAERRGRYLAGCGALPSVRFRIWIHSSFSGVVLDRGNNLIKTSSPIRIAETFDGDRRDHTSEEPETLSWVVPEPRGELSEPCPQ